MANPLFSVLIANYNNGLFLEEALGSVLDQTYSNWEVILIDDGSTDHSNVLYKNINNKKVKIFYNGKNKGIAYTKHRCIELAKGKYCGFLDPDDRLTPDALEKVVAIFEKGLPSVSLVYSNFYVCRDTMAKCYTAPIYDIPVKLNLLVGLKPDAFSAFRKRSYFETTGIDQKLEKAIDRDLVLKLEEQGDTIKIDDCLYYYRFHEKATSNYQNAFKAEYWAWKCRYAACKRRGLKEEDVYCLVKKYTNASQKKHLENSIDFRLGKFILTPARWLKRFFKSCSILQ